MARLEDITVKVTVDTSELDAALALRAARDWRGTPIRVGSTVVYPSRQSSSTWMNEGIVVSLEQVDHPYRSGDKVWKIGVRGTREQHYGSVAPKGGRVAYPDPNRITVVDVVYYRVDGRPVAELAGSVEEPGVARVEADAEHWQFPSDAERDLALGVDRH